jgi:hypothetical protein
MDIHFVNKICSLLAENIYYIASINTMSNESSVVVIWKTQYENACLKIIFKKRYKIFGI